MKKKYNVVIEETVSKTFEIIADDENQAKSIAAEKYKSGEFVLAPGELTAKQIQVSNDNDIFMDWEEF